MLRDLYARNVLRDLYARNLLRHWYCDIDCRVLNEVRFSAGVGPDGTVPGALVNVVVCPGNDHVACVTIVTYLVSASVAVNFNTTVSASRSLEARSIL